jgi:hypothetical protein
MRGRRIGSGAFIGILRVIGSAIAGPLWHAYREGCSGLTPQLSCKGII